MGESVQMERLSLLTDDQLGWIDKTVTAVETNKKMRTPICKLDFNNETKAFIQRKNVPVEINKVVEFTKFSPLINHKKHIDTPNLKLIQFKSSPMQLFNSFTSNSPFLLSKTNPIAEKAIAPEEKTTQKKICCNCKKSHCLKLYCQCFINKSYCHGCNCLNCFNTKEHEEIRNKTMKVTLQRNPIAFEPKISQVEEIVYLPEK
jgi:hypothetical protein